MSLIVLDRDGVINHDSDHYIRNAEQFRPMPGSIAAIAKLCSKGHQVCIATNQSGIGRGLYDHQSLNEIHQKLGNLVEKSGYKLSGFWFCPHAPDDNCDCRKPKPGMLLDIAKRWSTDVEDMVFVGDSFRDIQAAQEANVRPALVLTGNGLKDRETYSDQLQGVEMFRDLSDFAQRI